MASIGIDELHTRTSEILRRVREDGETIDVTDGGAVVARVVPVESNRTGEWKDDRDATEAWLRRADGLSKEIGSLWPKGVSAVDAIRDVRRDL